MVNQQKKMKKIIEKLSYKTRSRWNAWFHQRKKQKIRRRILSHFAQHPPQDHELQEAVGYLSKHTLSTFYGTFQDKYHADQVIVHTDTSNGLPYVITEGKRLYFKRSFNKRTVQLLYNILCVEQDRDAPHCYTDPAFGINEGDILADVGCAEGYFSLLHIEKLKTTYLFEQDREWIEALEATFSPWKEKVIIVPAFVSDKDDNEHVSLDNFFLQISGKPVFYKIDVEGAEASVLKGMNRLLKSTTAKIALCTYHHKEDFDVFSRFFEASGFRQRANPGLMIYQNDLDHMDPPFFRKCLIKAMNYEV